MSDFIRVWTKIDISDVMAHLLIVGESTGDCAKCRELGINYSEATTCPKCGTPFKYITSRTREVTRIKNKRPHLVFIDFDDYKKATGKLKARGLFG